MRPIDHEGGLLDQLEHMQACGLIRSYRFDVDENCRLVLYVVPSAYPAFVEADIGFMLEPEIKP